MKANFRRGLFLIVTVLAFAVAVYSYRYLLPGSPGSSPMVMSNRFVRLGAVSVHAGFAATALLLGPIQFIRVLRNRWPRIHRWIGTTYVACCIIGGCAGLLLAFGTVAGWVASIGFGSLAIVWIACTAQAWGFARRRKFASHERWMIRSFALTLAAVTLRLYIPIALLLHLNLNTAYQAISYLCWIPNLAVAELLLVFAFSGRSFPRQPIEQA